MPIDDASRAMVAENVKVPTGNLINKYSILVQVTGLLRWIRNLRQYPRQPLSVGTGVSEDIGPISSPSIRIVSLRSNAAIAQAAAMTRSKIGRPIQIMSVPKPTDIPVTRKTK